MRVVFNDLQQLDNPMNGKTLESAVSITEALQLLSGRRPFLFELRAENGFTLTVGFAGNCGCVQHRASNGSPPYLMALSDENADDGQAIEFLAGNTPTPIPRRFCLPIKSVEHIASEFIERGNKLEDVHWEEI
jgi:Immunity protein Imm1